MDPGLRKPAANGQMTPGSPRSPNDAARPEPLRPLNAQAARFEDEKRRIMSTCFSKRDPSGKLVQSYITHVRVEEDAAYPSAPPPPDSNPQYKKPRVIILAVMANGRVLMHKARENDDGTFQIGKSWGLDELISIETFVNSLPKTQEEQQRTEWAGSTGFVINMSKPYYWSAKSSKEKDFFIGSLVKVYNKFTGGKTPELIGFDQKDKDVMLSSLKPLGASNGRPQMPGPQSQSPKPSPGLNSTFQSASPAPQARNAPGVDRQTNNGSTTDLNSRQNILPDSGVPSSLMPSKSPPTIGSRQFQAYQSVPPAPSPAFSTAPQSRNATPHLSSRPSQENGLRQTSNIPGSLRPAASQEASRNPTPSSPVKFPDPNNHMPSMASVERLREARTQEPSPKPLNQPSQTPPASSATVDRWKPPLSPERDPRRNLTNNAYSSPAKSELDNPVSNGVATKIPERRRPPLQDSMYGDGERLSRIDSNLSKTPGSPGSPSSKVTPTQTQASVQPLNISRSESATTSNENFRVAKSEQSLSDQKSIEDSAEKEKPSEVDSSDETPQYRPGLGPMTGRKLDVANKFRKAATAHKAFVPRAGGAGERMFGKVKLTNDNEPDGITGVVPARSPARKLSKDDSNTSEQARPQSPKIVDKGPGPSPLRIPQQEGTYPPTVKVDDSRLEVPQDDHMQVHPLSRELSHDEMPKPLAIQKPTKSLERAKVKRKPNPFANALSAMGLDLTLAQDPRAIKFEENLNDFGWDRDFLQKRKYDTLQANMRKEVGRMEAGTWLGHSEHKDDRVDAFEKSIDKAIAAVDDMDGLLTLYSVELTTLADDVAYIEAQSQGLQVQTANQKLLQSELENLVNTISLDGRQLEPLRSSSLDDLQGQESIEASLSLLYKAIQKIDPKALTRSGLQSTGDLEENQGMRALQERKERYMNETQDFVFRFKQYMDSTFNSTFTKSRSERKRSNSLSSTGSSSYDQARKEIWKYNQILLFVKELDIVCWKDILKSYQARARDMYQDEIRDSINEWKKRARNTMTEEQEALFTHQEKEKEHEGLASTARKMTVKRSITVAKSLRQASNEKRTAVPRTQEANLSSATAFAGVLTDLMPTISAEQNFMTDFFHASSVENLEFVDAIILEKPDERHIPDLKAKRIQDPDKMMSGTVSQAMDAIFASWSIETHNMLEWTIGQGPFQAIGVLACLERARQNLEDTNQEYLVKIIQRQRDFIIHKFEPFISEQINAIENVKIKTNKRRGVMSFTRAFPLFAITTENMVPQFNEGSDDSEFPLPETRKLIDNAYARIINTVFRALDSIAKETTLGASTNPSAADSEDKEALNAMILLIENNYHLATEIEAGKNSTLIDCRQRAERTMLSHRERYVTAVIRRPLGRILDFLDQVENDRRAAGLATHSRSAFKKLLSGYDSKSVRRDVDALKKRVEKHFSGGDSGSDDHPNSISTGGGQNRLATEVLEVCEKRWNEILERTEKVCRDLYDSELAVEYSRQDVTMAFKR